MTRRRLGFALAASCVAALLAAPSSTAARRGAARDAPNLLLVLIDDVGVDRVVAYREHHRAGVTPTLDSLAARGVLFRNAYSNPLCSPTRGSLMTGLLPSRTGITWNTNAQGRHTLEAADFTVAEMLSAEGYATACAGKWHLSRELDAPRTVGGFGSYRGVLDNTGSYRIYEKVVDGVANWNLNGPYLTTDEVDDAVEFVTTLPEPWFVYLSFHAAHGPWHAPPRSLRTIRLDGQPEDDPPLFERAMVEAMDTELGRLMSHVDVSDTYVVVLGDNGTPGKATDVPFDSSRAKSTPYEGGINVPMIVLGPGIPVGESDALVHATDVWSTLADLAGSSASRPIDSVSLVGELFGGGGPLHPWVASELHKESFDRQWSARDRRHKLIRWRLLSSVREEFYDLRSDPWETVDLLPGGLTAGQAASYARLSAAIGSL